MLLIITEAYSAQPKKTLILIAPNLHHLDVRHKGKIVRIQREQNTQHRLTSSFSRTSRPCPPFCANPFQVAANVKVVGELELFDFLRNKSRKGKGILVDGRLPAWYAKATIPSAVNLPFPLFDNNIDTPIIKRILVILGADQINHSQWDFSEAKELLVFGNGIWGIQAIHAIQNLLALGYPAEKIYWYRGGLQDWLQVGLTTVRSQK
jgi:rhodanese-related sulfurtransferase